MKIQVSCYPSIIILTALQYNSAGWEEDLKPFNGDMIVEARKMDTISEVSTILGFSWVTIARINQGYMNSGKISATWKMWPATSNARAGLSMTNNDNNHLKERNTA